jgi:hypothetical protein
MIQGRNAEEIKAILDATHRIVVSAFKVPERDRYQVVHEHPPFSILTMSAAIQARAPRGR